MFSNNYRGDPPKQKDYENAIRYYLDSDYMTTEIALDETNSHRFFYALTFMAYEQFAANPQERNIIGRSSILFRKYKDRLHSQTNLSVNEFLSIAMSIFLNSLHEEHIYTFNQLALTDIPSITPDGMSKFLSFFSANYEEYKKHTKGFGADNIGRYGFKPLWRYPIIKTRRDEYCIPIRNVFLQATTENLFYLILDSFPTNEERIAFLNEFGNNLESYITDLFRAQFGDVVPCDQIPEIKGPRAEFYVAHESRNLIIECKRFSFKRETMELRKTEEIDKELYRLWEAFKQIENSMDYLESDKNIGLIVTYGHVPFANSDEVREIIETISKEKDGTIRNFPANIVLVSLDELEKLLANPPNLIFEILDAEINTPMAERGYFSNFLRTFPHAKFINPLLEKEADLIFSHTIGDTTYPD